MVSHTIDLLVGIEQRIHSSMIIIINNNIIWLLIDRVNF